MLSITQFLPRKTTTPWDRRFRIQPVRRPAPTPLTPWAIGNSSSDLKYLRILYASYGIHTYGATVRHSQFLHCATAIATDGGTFKALNVLMNDVGSAFGGYQFSGHAEHLTFDQGNLLTDSYYGYPPGTSVDLVNSLLVG